jgi:hypothetical protein
MVMEDHVLSAAMKLSHGEDLITTITNLHEGIKALEDALTHNLEAFNWFNLSIPTGLLICQPSQSLPAAEINYSSLLLNQFKTPVGLENEAGLAFPPYTPKGFPSASTILQSPSINPQLLEFGQLRLNEDVPMVKDNCMQTETQMQTKQDGEPKKHESRQCSWITQMLAMRIVGGMCARKTLMVGMVKAGARRGRISMLFESKRHRKIRWKRIMKRRGKKSRENSKRSRKMRTKRPRVNQRSFEFDSHLSSEKEEEEEEEEKEDLQEQEQDKKEKDAAELDLEKSDLEEERGEQSDAVEEDAEESDAVEEDSAEKDREEEDKEQVKLLPKRDLRRSAHLQMRTANPSSSYEPPARTQKQPGGNASKSKSLRTRENLLKVVSVSN